MPKLLLHCLAVAPFIADQTFSTVRHLLQREPEVTTRKKILIIAGPNGAGKTTFADDFLQNIWMTQSSSMRI